jgi:ABC-type multidrug transport system permease subunit
MLRVLLAKDLRRAWRNPLPWVINLALPLCITALIGLAFGGKSDNGALGRIRFAIVDEDDSVVSRFLRSAANQSEGSKYLEPVFLERKAALREVENDKLSAVLIIPQHFTRNYLTGREAVGLELIKNPAQSVHPAVLEELLGAVITALNAISRNFQSEFPEWQTVFEGRADYHKIAALIERAGDRIQTVEKYVNPPLVSYEREVRASGSKAGGGPAFNLFAYLLAGMTAMFLLFLASNGMSDLHRELQQRTFERFHTLRQQLLPFVAGKVVFTVVVLLLSSVIMLGGGALVFRIHWQQPVALLALTFGYACFAAGLMALMVTLVTDEHRAGALTNIIGMMLSIAGGCAFPPQGLPAFVRDHISPLLPTYWFSESVRSLQSASANVSWVIVSLKLAVLSAVLVALATFLFRRRFKIGGRG